MLVVLASTAIAEGNSTVNILKIHGVNGTSVVGWQPGIGYPSNFQFTVTSNILNNGDQALNFSCGVNCPAGNYTDELVSLGYYTSGSINGTSLVTQVAGGQSGELVLNYQDNNYACAINLSRGSVVTTNNNTEISNAWLILNQTKNAGTSPFSSPFAAVVENATTPNNTNYITTISCEPTATPTNLSPHNFVFASGGVNTFVVDGNANYTESSKTVKFANTSTYTVTNIEPSTTMSDPASVNLEGSQYDATTDQLLFSYYTPVSYASIKSLIPQTSGFTAYKTLSAIGLFNITVTSNYSPTTPCVLANVPVAVGQDGSTYIFPNDGQNGDMSISSTGSSNVSKLAEQCTRLKGFGNGAMLDVEPQNGSFTFATDIN
jgi:hypothetical protein